MAKESVESLTQRAQQAVAKGKNDEARQLYVQALGQRGDAPDVHYGLATVYFLLGDLHQAAYHFKEVTRFDPLRAGAYINLGAVFNRLDQLDDAIPMLRRGIQLDMNRAEGYYNLGLVYRRKGQPDLAIQAYREAVRVNPRMADAHYNLGNLYLEKEQFGLAVAHYRHSVELRPTWEKAQRGLEQAEAAQEATEVQAPTTAALPTKEISEAPVPPPPPSMDPERLVDPDIHSVVLTSLHKATIESDTHGRDFLKTLEGEIEPAIKNLSRCLLDPDSRVSDLEVCVQKFESAITNIQAAQDQLEKALNRVRVFGDKLLKS